MIDRYFKLAENQTTVKQEMLGGLTTFVTMAYIIVVNPQILAQAGMPAEGVVFATCISSAAATLVMGLYANYPIALAPGMSLNAYFTYAVCLNMHVPWQTALAVVFFSGVLFLLLTVTRVREQIVNGMPDCLKHSTATGIGMFIAFVGLRNAKLGPNHVYDSLVVAEHVEQRDAGLAAATFQRVKLSCGGCVHDGQRAVLGRDRMVHHGESQVRTPDLPARALQSRKCLRRRDFVNEMAVDIN